MLTWFSSNVEYLVSRNRRADPQVFISDFIQEPDSEIFRPDACDHRMPDGIPTVPDGYTIVPYLYRKL